MIGKAFIGTTVLALLSSVSACSCLPPPPLSECAVRDNEAALLVRVVARQTFQCNQFEGSAIADVYISRVFKDNTDLELKRGTVVSIESSLFGNLCGFDLLTGTQYIVFANGPFVPKTDDDDEEPVIEVDDASDEDGDDEDEPDEKPARRLRATKVASIKISATATDGASVSSRGFSDGDTCDIPTADLSTSLCSGNVVDPKKKDIEQLAAGCAALMEAAADDEATA